MSILESELSLRTVASRILEGGLPQEGSGQGGIIYYGCTDLADQALTQIHNSLVRVEEKGLFGEIVVYRGKVGRYGSPFKLQKKPAEIRINVDDPAHLQFILNVAHALKVLRSHPRLSMNIPGYLGWLAQTR